MSRMERREDFESRWTDVRRIRDLEQQIESLRASIEKISPASASSSAISVNPPPCAIGAPGLTSEMIAFAAESHTARPQLSPSPSDSTVSDNALRASRVRERIRQRRTRESLFNTDLFADPAWDMLLDLYAAELEGGDVSVSSLCIAAAVPTTTALRWIKLLSDQGWLVRQQDPHDGRRINMRLSKGSRSRLNRYFDALKL
jgi:DNA-binding MarR family transcriptional regulator